MHVDLVRPKPHDLELLRVIRLGSGSRREPVPDVDVAHLVGNPVHRDEAPHEREVARDPAGFLGQLIARGLLGNIARARGMSQLARKTGLTREGLYKALSPGGNPEFGTVMKAIRALGLELRGAAAKG